jgi:hypothetical protein
MKSRIASGGLGLEGFDAVLKIMIFIAESTF